VVEVPLRGAG